MNERDVRDSGTRGPARLGRRRWAMLGIFTLSSFIVVLDFGSFFIPLPSIMEDLGGTLDEVTWVIGAFILAFAVFLLPFGRLADMYDSRLLFLSGVTVFILASVACALAPSIEFLIGARAVLGTGAAMLEASVYALIKSTFSPERQSLAFRVQGSAFILGAFLAPILSGAITTGLSWEYIFWLNVVVGVGVFAGALPLIPASRGEGESRRLDVTGLVSGGTGLFALFFAIIEGSRFGWGSAAILGSFGAAVVLLALFVAAESRARDPLVRLSLFNDRIFAVGNLLRWASDFASLGVFFALSHFVQVQLGYSALVMGLLLMSVNVGALVIAPFTEPLSGRVDVRLIVVPGFLLVAGGTFWVAHVSPETGWVFFLAPLAIVGAGFGAQEGPIMTARDRDVPPALANAAWRVSYSIFLLGVGLGAAVVSAVWQSQFVANAKEAISGAELPPGIADRVASSLFEGGVSGQPGARISGPGATQVQRLIEVAFANAVNTALLGCVVVALLGAVVALFLSSNRK